MWYVRLWHCQEEVVVVLGSVDIVDKKLWCMAIATLMGLVSRGEVLSVETPARRQRGQDSDELLQDSSISSSCVMLIDPRSYIRVVHDI